MAFFFPEACSAQGDALIDRAVVADLGGLADDDADAMIDEQAAADLRAGMDVDRRQDAPEMRHEPAREMPAAPPEPMAKPMEQQHLEPGVAEDDFEP